MCSIDFYHGSRSSVRHWKGWVLLPEQDNGLSSASWLPDLDVIKTSHPALFQPSSKNSSYGWQRGNSPSEHACVGIGTTESPGKHFQVLTEHQEELFKNENNNKKEVFAEFRRPVQTDSKHEQQPTLPFNPCTYCVALGAAHPSPTPEPRDTPALSVTPFSTYWRQKKVQFTLLQLH